MSPTKTHQRCMIYVLDAASNLDSGGAPVSRAMVLATAGSSILVQAMRATRRPTPPYVAAFEQAFAYRHPGELLFGVGLMYYFRYGSLQNGTEKKILCFQLVSLSSCGSLACAGTGCWSGKQAHQSLAAGCWQRRGSRTCCSWLQSTASGGLSNRLLPLRARTLSVKTPLDKI